MDIKSRFGQKLGNLLFLEMDKERIERLFNVNIEESIYLPIKSANIIEEVKKNGELKSIPLGFFIEGMYFVLGADETFKYNTYYKKMLESIDESVNFVKGNIAKEINAENYEDAYIFLKGLTSVEATKDNYDKLLMVVDKLRITDKSYKDEEFNIIEKAKEVEDNLMPYIYETIINKDHGDYVKALYCINEYISKGGEATLEIVDLKTSLKDAVEYDKAKEIIFENPKEALKIFLSMLEQYADDAVLYYYIAVAYRNLENHEKAIYYLNEALMIDSALVQVVNELGVNYAALGDFEKAISYFRKAFEATKSIEICTNLVMCYLNTGDMKQAKIHLEIAEKLDAEDEVVKDLKKIIDK